jgi:glycolate oxidase FAD binding subunit
MMLPLERAAPTDVASVAEIVGRCDRERKKIAIVGGDTLSGMGLPLERADLTLVTTELSKVVDYESADLTVATQAGVTLQSLAALLGRHAQFVPFDAPLPQYATIGGTLAAGWLGPRRHLYGRPRDLVIGSTAVLADGTIARAGGMVVKNVAGYDLSRLYAGSFGTLSVLTQANFKTLPLPEKTHVFLARLPEGTRTRACAQMRALAVAPAAAWWVQGFHNAIDGEEGQEGRLVVVLEGTEALLHRATRDLRSALGRAGVPETRVMESGGRESMERVIDAYVATLGERSITYRLLGFPAEAPARAAAVQELAERFELRCECIVDVMNGDAILRASDLDARALATKVETFDDALHDAEPRAQVIACNHPHRVNLCVWGELPPSIDRMRALKARFDPNNTLNPGRFIGGI